MLKIIRPQGVARGLAVVLMVTSTFTSACVLQVGEIEVSVRPKSVKRINLRLNVKENKFYASAPIGIRIEQIQYFLNQQYSWMQRTLNRHANLSQPFALDSSILNGSQFPLWGEQVTITFFPPQNQPAEGTQCLAIAVIARQLEQFYKTEITLAARGLIDELAAKMGVNPKRLTIRKMTSRWGTCNHRTGRITINQQLAKLPMEYLRYVVVHELAHLRHPHHGDTFWRFVSDFEPQYQHLHAQLKNIKL